MKTAEVQVPVVFHTKSETCEWCSPLALISGFQPITQTSDVTCSGKTVEAQISDVKTAIIYSVNRLFNRFFAALFLTDHQ